MCSKTLLNSPSACKLTPRSRSRCRWICAEIQLSAIGGGEVGGGGMTWMSLLLEEDALSSSKLNLKTVRGKMGSNGASTADPPQT